MCMCECLCVCIHVTLHIHAVPMEAGSMSDPLELESQPTVSHCGRWETTEPLYKNSQC